MLSDCVSDGHFALQDSLPRKPYQRAPLNLNEWPLNKVRQIRYRVCAVTTLIELQVSFAGNLKPTGNRIGLVEMFLLGFCGTP